MSFLIPSAQAAVDPKVLGGVLDPIIQNVVSPLVGLAFIVAVVMFAWGAIQMIMKADDSEARDNGKRHMLYGTIGMAIMVSAWGIIHFIGETISGI